MPKIRVIHAHRFDWWFYVGPYVGRLVIGPGSFGWLDTDGSLTRFIRKWWSGWSRWDEDLEW